MAQAFKIPAEATKEDIYRELLPQIAAVISDTSDLIANLANIAAILKTAFSFHWVGFYRATSSNILTLGPFQGPLACVTIPFSKGVCGTAAREQKTILVDDVDLFPGHIACSSLSKSEIVVPLVCNNQTQLVLDIDSDRSRYFDETDRYYLEEIIKTLARHHFL